MELNSRRRQKYHNKVLLKQLEVSWEGMSQDAIESEVLKKPYVPSLLHYLAS